MAYPNVILAGAPKCGTTSVFRYLADHPDVCASSVKETYFMMDRNYPLFNKHNINFHDNGLEAYQEFFRHCHVREYSVILEATPDYLYQQTPFKVIPMLEEIPRLVFVFRKPSERVYSMYQFVINNLSSLDGNISFAKFVTLLKSESDNPVKRRLILGNTIEHSKYINYLDNWLNVLGRENIIVLLFEELRDDALSFMSRLSRELGISQAIYDGYDFGRENLTYRVRSQWLQRMKRNLSRKSTGNPVIRLLRNRAGAFYRKMNLRNPPAARSDEDLDQLARLDREFLPFNEELALRTGIELTQWA